MKVFNSNKKWDKKAETSKTKPTACPPVLDL